jgi:hypothetical protein
MIKFREDSAFIAPADKSIVLLKSSASIKQAWVTVHKSDLMFGLRRIHMPTQGDPSTSEGMFFLNADDNVRTSVSIGTPAEMCAGKPDESGTMCMTMLFPNDLNVSMSSTGTVLISSPISQKPLDAQNLSPNKMDVKISSLLRSTSLVAPEAKRLICNGGCVVRFLTMGGPFSRDILFPNGTRVLVRSFGDEAEESVNYIYPVAGFMESIVKEAPPSIGDTEWQYVILDTHGNVLYSYSEYGADHEDSITVSQTIPNISSHYIDAETQALITEFKDGRVICISTDDLLDVYFPDGTRITTHQSGEVVFIDFPGYPSLEIDVEIDKISRMHSKGHTVPIAKGGDKIRTKVAMPDGTAVMIKYDTRVTSTYNGSIKAIRRDKSIIYAMDGGILNFVTSDEWNEKVR